MKAIDIRIFSIRFSINKVIMLFTDRVGDSTKTYSQNAMSIERFELVQRLFKRRNIVNSHVVQDKDQCLRFGEFQSRTGDGKIDPRANVHCIGDVGVMLTSGVVVGEQD
jgi:hypothetical protein